MALSSVVLIVILALTMSVAAGQTSAPAPRRAALLAHLPPPLLAIIKNDVGALDTQDCFEEHHARFEQMVKVEWLSLHAKSGPSLLVQGLGPCLAGGNNGPFLLYARIGHQWRKVFDQIGQRIRRMPAGRDGWRGLEFFQHDSADSTVRLVYRFAGARYRAVGCTIVRFPAQEGTKRNSTPVHDSCEWDWRESEQ